MTVEALPAPDPANDPRKASRPKMTEEEIVRLLTSYRQEAQDGRKTGPNPRDATWERNWNLYWGRYDFSKKAPWQSRIVMPEAPQAIDRWSAAMKEALLQSGGEWYDFEDTADADGDLKAHKKKFMDMLLRGCGRTPDGHVLAFPAVFEEMVKAGALTAMSATVTWKTDRRTGRGFAAVDCCDARTLWLDPQNRNLYRVRRIHIDKHDLLAMAKQADGTGASLYDVEAIRRLTAHVDEEAGKERETSSGGNAGGTATPRVAVVLDEYLCTVLDSEGNSLGDNQLCVVGNDKFLIRGPEQNPFWHARDWNVLAPLINVPFSVYGKSYVENWSSVVEAFIEMTNLILDGTYITTMKAFAIVPDMLEDPTEAEEGVTPNKTFQLQEGMSARDFLAAIDLGNIPAESIRVWQALKDEAREGQNMSDIALGQVPQKGGISATEISETSANSSAFVKSMAESIEQRFLEQLLTLLWWTGLQHTDFTDPAVVAALGEETASMFATRRDDFRSTGATFRVTGISSIIKRGQALRQLLAAMAVISSSEPLLQKFMERYDVGRLMDQIFALHGVDTSKLEMTERERMIRGVLDQIKGAAGGAQPGQGGGGSTGINSALVPPTGAGG